MTFLIYYTDGSWTLWSFWSAAALTGGWNRVLSFVCLRDSPLRHHFTSMRGLQRWRNKRAKRKRDGMQTRRQSRRQTSMQMLSSSFLSWWVRTIWRKWQTGEWRRFRCRWRHLCCFSPWWSPHRRWGRSLPLRSASSLGSSRRLCPPLWCTTPGNG